MNFQLDLFGEGIVARATALFGELEMQDEAARIRTINAIRAELHKYSPFASEPVDCVQWVPIEDVIANDYNPNSVAPPEMRLLEHSITEDGYTQPIVAWQQGDHFEVIDGFHRNRVGRECPAVRKRIKEHLPLAIINSEREDRGDRIASTIRHNRARGKHQIAAMSDIVVELKRRNWADEKIGRELGMDPDEVLRLSQITGLSEMFADREFSEAWEANEINEADSMEIQEEDPTCPEEN
jgi:ParB-like chromosome segregation protein Spo0J